MNIKPITEEERETLKKAFKDKEILMLFDKFYIDYFDSKGFKDPVYVFEQVFEKKYDMIQHECFQSFLSNHTKILNKIWYPMQQKVSDFELVFRDKTSDKHITCIQIPYSDLINESSFQRILIMLNSYFFPIILTEACRQGILEGDRKSIDFVNSTAAHSDEDSFEKILKIIKQKDTEYYNKLLEFTEIKNV